MFFLLLDGEGVAHLTLLFAFFVCFQTGPFSMGSPPLTTYNQQLWLTCVVQAEHSNSKTTDMTLK